MSYEKNKILLISIQGLVNILEKAKWKFLILVSHTFMAAQFK